MNTTQAPVKQRSEWDLNPDPTFQLTTFLGGGTLYLNSSTIELGSNCLKVDRVRNWLAWGRRYPWQPYEQPPTKATSHRNSLWNNINPVLARTGGEGGKRYWYQKQNGHAMNQQACKKAQSKYNKIPCKLVVTPNSRNDINCQPDQHFLKPFLFGHSVTCHSFWKRLVQNHLRCYSPTLIIWISRLSELAFLVSAFHQY